mmetsp:Transcript_111426/g.296094  ORF Transcript_111426/g.296094 Transcript_111426/m.296094 type:complete len:424 (-) Transcript_111426:927-2198(-)
MTWWLGSLFLRIFPPLPLLPRRPALPLVLGLLLVRREDDRKLLFGLELVAAAVREELEDDHRHWQKRERLDDHQQLHDSGPVLALLRGRLPNLLLRLHLTWQARFVLSEDGRPTGIVIADPNVVRLYPVWACGVPADVAPFVRRCRVPRCAVGSVVHPVAIQQAGVEVGILDIRGVHAQLGAGAARVLAELVAPDLLRLCVPIDPDAVVQASLSPRLLDITPKLALAEAVFVRLTALGVLEVAYTSVSLKTSQHLDGGARLEAPECILVKVVGPSVGGLEVKPDRHWIPLEVRAVRPHLLGGSLRNGLQVGRRHGHQLKGMLADLVFVAAIGLLDDLCANHTTTRVNCADKELGGEVVVQLSCLIKRRLFQPRLDPRCGSLALLAGLTPRRLVAHPRNARFGDVEEAQRVPRDLCVHLVCANA